MNIYLLAAAAAAIIILIACSSSFIWRVVERVWLRPRRLERSLRAQGLKGNPYRFWFGDSKDQVAITMATQLSSIGLDDDVTLYALPFHHHILTKYGKRSFMWFGPTPRIMVMNPDMVKDVLQKHETFVKVLTKSPWTKLFVSGLVAYEGDKWAKHRRLLNPSFTVAKLKGMVPLMHVSCKELVDKLDTMILNKTSEEVDMWPIISKFTADVISRTAFGSNYKEGQKIFLLQKEQAQLFVYLNRLVYIPGSRYLPNKTAKRFKQISMEIRDLLRGIIGKRMEGLKAGHNESSSDLLGILLESNMKEVEENGDEKGKGIAIEEVMDECKLFYFAGQETTSNLLVWTMVMLCIHQNWQMEARQEVFEVFGESLPDFDGLHQLKKVNMILHEVLRLYPSVASLMRTVKEDTKLGDMIIHLGVEVILPILLIHHDKEIWGDDAKEFKPERFSQGVAKAANGHPAAFFPFSFGPRICIGMNFSMVEAKLALAMMLQRFSFELSPSYEHAPVPFPTMQPKFGAKIMVSEI